MQNSKFITLVRLLHDRTTNGRFGWVKGVKDGTYLASFSGFSVLIKKEAKQANVPADIVIGVFDSSGNLVDEFSDVDLEAPDFDAFDMMTSLYNVARRQALGSDKAIDTILADLNQMDP